MRKTALLLAIVFAATSATSALAAKKKKAAAPPPAPQAQTFEQLNDAGLRLMRDWFMAPQYMATNTLPPKK